MKLRHILGRMLILPVKGYQRLISPLLPKACIYYPSCSHYMEQSIRILGPGKGLVMGLGRIVRCSGFFIGGVDKVPRHLPWKLVFPWMARRWKKHSWRSKDR